MAKKYDFRQCSIKDCNSTRDNDHTLFPLPVDTTLCDRWMKCIEDNLKNGMLAMKSLIMVCELHFEDRFLIKNMLLKVKDEKGEVRYKKILKLKKWAVPTIFPNSNLNVVTQDSNSSKHIVIVQKENDTNSSKTKVVEKSQEVVNESIGYNYKSLQIDLYGAATRGLPPYWQYVGGSLGCLLVYLGDSKRHVSRSIHIDQQLEVQIRLEGRIITPEFVQKIQSVYDVFNLMEKVSKSLICEGPDQIKNCPNGIYFAKFSTMKHCNDCMIMKRIQREREGKLRKYQFAHIKAEIKLKHLKEQHEKMQKLYEKTRPPAESTPAQPQPFEELKEDRIFSDDDDFYWD